MKQQIYDEKNGLTYTLAGDYYLPNLMIADGVKSTYGKYGLLRLDYLKQFKQAVYITLLTQGTLVQYLNDFDVEASERVEYLIESMKRRQGITGQLKEKDQMKWVGMMNNIKNAVEEIVLKKLVYA
ncbi:TnpV protein [Extibacter muris]|uniref:TnpV protein n=1 Tax=Extibacter muris TaxID=1796622 RepID=UPI001D09165E|nr:TnpV protein [Extibacter muris]MCB6200824.1 TnpV protein [Extibacter muris]MCQ4662155.1 TnpV protein [Extibacter muris]MCQ4691932.1 TnpV protein [Extibacter muris]